jgi:hypothetical protein
MGARVELDRLFERHTADDVADAALLVGIGMIERACVRSREALEFRWRSYPGGELRVLRRGVRTGLEVCRFATLLAEADRERFEEGLAAHLAQQAAREAARAKR